MFPVLAVFVDTSYNGKWHSFVVDMLTVLDQLDLRLLKIFQILYRIK